MGGRKNGPNQAARKGVLNGGRGLRNGRQTVMSVSAVPRCAQRWSRSEKWAVGKSAGFAGLQDVLNGGRGLRNGRSSAADRQSALRLCSTVVAV